MFGPRVALLLHHLGMMRMLIAPVVVHVIATRCPVLTDATDVATTIAPAMVTTVILYANPNDNQTFLTSN